ncbi:hypothetical protein HOY82DRAFT_535860 [Tuber indicum]|nr:hypothetical protein HOY82DRAFT_535860 [Tuber indicum]
MSLFFRLEKILGDRPNVPPPVSYDLGENAIDTAFTIEQLLVAMCNNNPDSAKEEGPSILDQCKVGREREVEVVNRDDGGRVEDEVGDRGRGFENELGITEEYLGLREGDSYPYRQIRESQEDK